MIPATKVNKGTYWAVVYNDNEGSEKELIIRQTEEELNAIISTVLTDGEGQPLKDEADNIKTMIYPFYLME